MYRIAVVNEIRGAKAVLDFRQYGTEVRVTLSWITKSAGGEGSSIMVFDNYNLILETKSKQQAWERVTKLLEDCPTDTTEEIKYFKRAIFGEV